jgi:DNA-directed RNA polymerase specialized sigma subunit
MNRVQFLAEKWLRTEDNDVLDNLARELRPRIEYLARNFDQMYQEDLVQHALSGLEDALRRYSPESGTLFHTYFHHRSLGRMRNYSRDNHRTIRVSRHFHDFIQSHSKFKERFTNEHGRPPSLQESAQFHGCTEEHLTEQFVLSRQPYSLNGVREIIQDNPEHEILGRMADKEFVAELIANVTAGKSLSYLFDGDTIKGRRATKLVKNYLKENQ